MPDYNMPNILFIYADDWGWGDLSWHDNPRVKTPHLAQLAQEGTEFCQFNVTSPVCSPSRVSVLTGHYPARYCIHQHFADHQHNMSCGMPDWLDPAAVTLPRLLKNDAGYVTAHFGKWHLTNRGVVDAPLPAEYGYDQSAVFNGPGPQTDFDTMFDQSVDFIKKHRKERFFINLWIHETHLPHVPTEKALKEFSGLDERQQVYSAVVRDGDRKIGRVLEELKKNGLDDDTLVVFSSDNGPECTGGPEQKMMGPGFGRFYSVGSTAGLKGRKRSLFEGGVRTPFIVKWPGNVPSGKINRHTVISSVDLLPTFCAAAGIEPPDDYSGDGENMLPALMGEDIRRKGELYWEWRGPGHGHNWPRLAVRDGDWKMAMTMDKKQVELYNVEKDFKEQHDLADTYPGIVDSLSAKAFRWKETLPKKPDPRCIAG